MKIAFAMVVGMVLTGCQTIEKPPEPPKTRCQAAVSLVNNREATAAQHLLAIEFLKANCMGQPSQAVAPASPPPTPATQKELTTAETKRLEQMGSAWRICLAQQAASMAPANETAESISTAALTLCQSHEVSIYNFTNPIIGQASAAQLVQIVKNKNKEDIRAMLIKARTSPSPPLPKKPEVSA